MKEEICTITLLGNEIKKIKVAHTNSVDKLIIDNSNFVCAENEGMLGRPDTIVSFMKSIGDNVVCLWELSNNDVYRLKIDICVSKEYKLSITKRSPDGSVRRTDLTIVL